MGYMEWAMVHILLMSVNLFLYLETASALFAAVIPMSFLMAAFNLYKHANQK